jgi:NAD+ diphosphatase
MTVFDPFSIHPKPPHHLSHGGLDRDDLGRRDDKRLTTLLAAPTTRFVPVWHNKNFFARNEAPHASMQALGLAAIADFIDPDKTIYLGQDRDGVSFVCVDISAHSEEQLQPLTAWGRFDDLRESDPSISGFDSSLLGYAKAMCHWHTRTRHCADCGDKTRPAQSGHTRVCINQSCMATHFPRTDSAIIVAVTFADKILLGRQPVWPEGMLSVLAGFVEPGETLEHAVAREVHEEAGVVVRNVHYQLSQPWPFPASLMLGFRAEAESDTIKINSHEIEAARWYSREDIRQFAQSKFYLPRKLSISRRLIDEWIAEG